MYKRQDQEDGQVDRAVGDGQLLHPVPGQRDDIHHRLRVQVLQLDDPELVVVPDVTQLVRRDGERLSAVEGVCGVVPHVDDAEEVRGGARGCPGAAKNISYVSKCTGC